MLKGDPPPSSNTEGGRDTYGAHAVDVDPDYEPLTSDDNEGGDGTDEDGDAFAGSESGGSGGGSSSSKSSTSSSSDSSSQAVTVVVCKARTSQKTLSKK